MPFLFPTSGVDPTITYIGIYNFNDATFYIPEVSVLPAAAQQNGAIYHVKNSGVVAVASGNGLYAIFSLGSL